MFAGLNETRSYAATFPGTILASGRQTVGRVGPV